MARIRTVKPDFFRHEELQDLELQYPELKPMLVFCALWGHCDKNGVFEWKPRYMQLDILPFVWEATGKHLGSTLMLLREYKFITTLSDGKKTYGFIPTFSEHQRINGKESQATTSYPQPTEMTEHIPSEAFEKHRGSTGEATETTGREGKGREGKLNLCAFDNARLSDFNLFWDTFDFKKGRGGAESSWMKIKNYSPELVQTIIEAAAQEAKLRPSLIAKGDSPKWAQGWITDRRWEDEYNVVEPVDPNWKPDYLRGVK